ncbi:MAG: carbohydrate kinase family protein [Schwartzia sp.]|nr:carbohydrate kinase family protein [Schwartzia sp. (in: firmicutes)]
MKPAVVIGTTFVDIKGFARNSYDPHGRNLGDVKFVHGGVGRNVVEDFANVGMPVSYVGMLEDSAIGMEVERHLAEIGADLRYVLKVPDHGIGMWLVILDENGDLAGSISKMPDIAQLEAYLKTKGDEIVSGAEAVVLEVDLNEQIAEMAVRLAKAHGKDVYSIVGNMSVVLARKDLIRQTKCFICNEVEAAKFFGADFPGAEPEAVRAWLPGAAEAAGLPSVVITLGAQGAVYYDAKTKAAGFRPPCPTKVVDTTGAGDAFFSGTVMGLIRGASLAKATGYGARLASATISQEENNCPVDRHFFKELAINKF